MGIFEQMQADAAAAPQAPQSLLDQMRMDAVAPVTTAAPQPSAVPPKSSLVMGMRDPVDAAAQLLRRAIPDSVGNAVDSFGNWLASKGAPVAPASGVQGVDQIVRDVGTAYEQQRPDQGTDWGRIAGNILSPVNLAVAGRLPAATTALGRIGTGAIAGSVGGALQPATSENFWTQKGAQVGLGAVTGGIASPILGGVVDKASQFLRSRAQIDPQALDATLRQVASDAGQHWDEMPPQIQQQLRDQVMSSLSSAKGLDPAAALRAADFAAEGMNPTLGQVTRDAGQFAAERNLRTMAGVGDPLLQRLEAQGQQLQGKVGSFADGASDNYTAGQKLADALQKYDASQSASVSAAYRQARASAGKDATIPLQGLAQDFADTLDRFGDKVPSGVRNQFMKFGLDPANPTDVKKLFTVEEADKLIKVINDNQSNDPATNAALSALRNAVKNAVTKDAGADDVFAPARALAAKRFELQEAVPALQAAATGSTAPDDFVRRFVINGKTQEVQKLAQLLQGSAPDAAAEARSQIGAYLQRSAYGENVAGDRAFSPDRFAKALRDMGDAKLSAFFNPDEVAQLHRLSRVGAYINSVPNAAPVQSSNNWGAIMTAASHIPGVSSMAGLLKGAKNIADAQTGVSRALAAKLPQAQGQLSPEDVQRLAQLLSAGSVGLGAASAQQLQR